jgi:hypothetical protein
MNRAITPVLLAPLAFALGAFVAPPAVACGEATFNVGKGLEYQGYLAPRPATVLIYGTPDPSTDAKQRDEVLAGLRSAGTRWWWSPTPTPTRRHCARATSTW